jgi:hypothetical protein
MQQRKARLASFFRHCLAHVPDILANEWRGETKKRRRERKRELSHVTPEDVRKSILYTRLAPWQFIRTTVFLILIHDKGAG